MARPQKDGSGAVRGATPEATPVATADAAQDAAQDAARDAAQARGASGAPTPAGGVGGRAGHSDIRAIREHADEISYSGQARSAFRTGDVLCFRGKGLSSWAIRTATRSVYSHCGLAYLHRGRVYCLEAVGSKGVRLALMSVLMDHYQGGIDHFDVPGAGESQREVAVGFGFEQLGKVYDKRGIVRFAKAILFKKRELVLEDQEWFCSELLAAAYERAGWPLAELQAAYTSPESLVAYGRLSFMASLKV